MSLRRIMLAGLVLVLASVPASAVERFIPVVAQTPGSGGAYWSTELWVTNLSPHTGTYGLVFLPTGVDNSERLLRQAEPVEIAPGATHYLDDVVPPDSTGALRVLASEGVVVQCHLYSVQGQGSQGQMVPALRRDEMIPVGSWGELVPLLRSSQYRTNVGLFNPASRLLKVRAVLVNPEGKDVGRAEYSLEPGSQTQLNDFLLGFKVVHSDGHRVRLSGDGPFTAYASIVDARTGSPAYVSPEIHGPERR
jgi:hypothetical protein